MFALSLRAHTKAEGKGTKEEASMEGKNGANGMSDIEGKAARVAANEYGNE